VVLTADRATVLGERKQAIGMATNNVAEYRGLIAGLTEAVELGATEVAVSMDSKLVVEQMAGRWRVKHPDLIELNREARRWRRASNTLPSNGSHGNATSMPTGWPTRRWMPPERRCGRRVRPRRSPAISMRPSSTPIPG
jgi:hypothetical protein